MATVTLKVDESIRQVWIACAEEEGCSLSEWLRRAGNQRAATKEGRPDVLLGVTDPPEPSQHLGRVAAAESVTEKVIRSEREETFELPPPEKDVDATPRRYVGREFKPDFKSERPKKKR